MGIDAPSTDMTARIQAKRRALAAAGQLNQERNPFTAQGGSAGAVDVSKYAALARAEERRAERAGGDRVVEFVYTEEEKALMLAAEDGGDGFPEDAEEYHPEEEAFAPPLADEMLVAQTDLDQRLVRIEAGLLEVSAQLREHISFSEEQHEGLGKGLIALAEHIAALPELLAPKPYPVPEPPAEKLGFWQKLRALEL